MGLQRTTTHDHDRNVRIRSRAARTVAMVALVIVGATARESAAHACSMVGPGIRARSVWPAADRLPTNARVVVRYDASGAGFPPLGQDLVLLDGATVVPTTAEVTRTDVALRPLAPLLPDHTYQLGDRRTLPCDTLFGDACPLGETTPFATFSTGSGEDTTAPTFAGVTSLAVGSHRSCDSGACCGPYDLHYVDATWSPAVDQEAGGSVRYRVYKREGTAKTLVADNIDDIKITGVAVCSGDWGSPQFTPGRYLVRAFDWAGNEDSNTVERRLGDPCTGGCAVAGTAPASGSAATPLALLLTLLVLAFATRQRLRTGSPPLNRSR